MNDILDLPGWTVLGKRLDGYRAEQRKQRDMSPAERLDDWLKDQW